jgi:hypothetical protein
LKRSGIVAIERELHNQMVLTRRLHHLHVSGVQATPVPDDHMEVPERLLRLGDGDTPSPKLVQGGLCGEQLVDGASHPPSMIDAWDIPATQV